MGAAPPTGDIRGGRALGVAALVGVEGVVGVEGCTRGVKGGGGRGCPMFIGCCTVSVASGGGDLIRSSTSLSISAF